MNADINNSELDNKTLCAPEKQLDSSVQGSSQKFPLPHIIVTCPQISDVKSSWGRKALQKIGYHESIRCFCKGYMYNSARDGPNWKKFLKKNAHRIRVYAKFHDRYGGGLDDLGWNRLQPIGWPEMLENVIELNVTWDIPKPL